MARGSGEAEWEALALEALAEQGWVWVPGKDLAPGSGERASWDSLVIPSRLRAAVARLNPEVPQHYREQAIAEILQVRSQDAITENHRVHGYLTQGYTGLEYLDDAGVAQHPVIRILSADPAKNDWLVANQVRLADRDHDRRFDIVLYVNGLPLAIVELKQAGAAHADVAAAHAQLDTYVAEFPSEFRFTVLTVASDGIVAKYGTPFTALNHFAPWNVDDDGAPVDLLAQDPDSAQTSLELAIDGLFNQERFLQLVRDFTVFSTRDGALEKRIAKPHQYFAVTKAVGATIHAVRGDGRAGVVWHTQGSGKSLEMELYAHAIAHRPELANPTIVVITDRTELDGQLFSAFERSQILPSKPVQIGTRKQLREVLSDARGGGIYFTTLQKFGRTRSERDDGLPHELLSDRHNIVIVVDEAHRSHYDDLDGYARHLRDALPHASLIAFTGTPISRADHDTRAVFGDDIDVYDLSRAVADGATVEVYFEPRLVQVARDCEVTAEQVDQAADEITTGLDDIERGRVEQAVTRLTRIYGAPDRLDVLVDDLLAHWDERADAMRDFIGTRGKAMIVCTTREVCVRVYDAIVARRPDWHSDADDRGKVKVVFSGDPTDPPAYRPHIRRPAAEKAVKARAADANDELELIIVKDMMLTGFDSPSLHTLYLDRPMHGALLMQTLARVNRTFKEKESGLLVAYAPVAESLEAALAEYSRNDQRTKPVGKPVSEAADALQQRLREIDELVTGYDWRARHTGAPGSLLRAAVGLTTYLRDAARNNVPEGVEPIGVAYRRLAGTLSQLWSLSRGSRETITQAEELAIRFYEQVRVAMAKLDAEDRRSRGEPIPEDIELLLGKVLDSSTDAPGVLDIYEAANLPRLSLSSLTPVAIKALRDAAADKDRAQIAIEQVRNLLLSKTASIRSNIPRSRQFSERIDELMTKYTNQQLTAAQIIAALIDLAKELSEDARRGERFSPPLSERELATYDALASNESATLAMGDDTLAQIARELIAIMRRDTRTDWTVRDDVKAKLRTSIRRLLVKYDYPPDKQPDAIALVMEQMESMAPDFERERREASAERAEEAHRE